MQSVGDSSSLQTYYIVYWGWGSIQSYRGLGSLQTSYIHLVGLGFRFSTDLVYTSIKVQVHYRPCIYVYCGSGSLQISYIVYWGSGSLQTSYIHLLRFSFTRDLVNTSVGVQVHYKPSLYIHWGSVSLHTSYIGILWFKFTTRLVYTSIVFQVHYRHRIQSIGVHYRHSIYVYWWSDSLQTSYILLLSRFTIDLVYMCIKVRRTYVQWGQGSLQTAYIYIYGASLKKLVIGRFLVPPQKVTCLFVLRFNFTRVRSDQSTTTISGLEQPSPHFPSLTEFNNIYAALWVINYFPD